MDRQTSGVRERTRDGKGQKCRMRKKKRKREKKFYVLKEEGREF
jgi:hypothetical protein